jgi:hypothetical protein
VSDALGAGAAALARELGWTAEPGRGAGGSLRAQASSATHGTSSQRSIPWRTRGPCENQETLQALGETRYLPGPMVPALRSFVCLALLVAGCKAGEPPRAPDGSQTPSLEGAPEAVEGTPAGASETTGSDAGGVSSAATPPGVSEPSAVAPAPGPAGAPPGPERRGPPLPELRVKSFGLHVGGTSRDAAAREDFLRALEKNSWRYLECYQLVEQPGSEGTFGADLHVGADGGKPSVSGVRTKLKGAEFRSCMERALEGTKFDLTPSGRSVVVSYSLKFSFAW